MGRRVGRWCGRLLPCACVLLALAACAALESMPRPASPSEQCLAWGYAPDDPECLRVFHRDPP